jgi:hypothetical protein
VAGFGRDDVALAERSATSRAVGKLPNSSARPMGISNSTVSNSSTSPTAESAASIRMPKQGEHESTPPEKPRRGLRSRRVASAWISAF